MLRTPITPCSRVLRACCAATSLLASPVLGAEPPQATAWDVSANVSLFSDYRFRGVSLSDRDPVVQAGVDAESDDGITTGIWASPVADTGGARTEIDIYGGYKTALHGFDVAVAAYSYLYPGGSGVNYLEVQGSVQRTFGPVRLGMLTAYTPRQRNVTDTDDIYVQANMVWAIANTPVSIRLATGFEDGFYDRKIDWEAAVRLEHKGVTASIAYIGSTEGAASPSGSNGKPMVVAGLAFGF